MPLRPLKSTDKALILDSWIKSYRGSPLARKVPNDAYYAHMRAMVNSLFNLNLAFGDGFKILCAPEDENVIQGWSAWSGDCLFYVFVGSAFRGLRLARGLVPKHIRRYNHFTLAGRPLLQALGCAWTEDGLPLPGGLIYDPWYTAEQL